MSDSTQENKHLHDLYPFLHDKRQDAGSLNAALVESVHQKIAHHQDVIDAFFKKNAQTVVNASGAVADTYRQDGRLYSMGNGGSSCDASHISVEFLHPITAGRPALPAVDLTIDKTMMTAVSNDVGYSHVFLRQIIAMVKPGDVVVGISTSGNSENLVNGFRKAKELGATTLGLAGGNGGEMAKMGLDHCLVVETDSIHRTQECHVAIYHVLWDLVHTLLADDRGNLGSS